MPRKDNSRNPLQLRIQAVSVPKTIKPEQYLERLKEVITEGRELPYGWDVRLHWRNPGVKYGQSKRWRYDNFFDAVTESRKGFNNILLWTIEAQLERVQQRRAHEQWMKKQKQTSKPKRRRSR